MDRIKAARIIAIFVTLSGLAGIFGWLYGVQVLRSVLPSMVTMKFTTAVSFFLSGIALFFVAESVRGRATVAQVVLPAATLIIMLIMATLLASVLFGVRTGIENLFIEEEAAALKTTVPGRPSIVTMADFIVVSIAAIAALFRARRQKKVFFIAGIFLLATGSLALMGYALGAEYLYYSWPGVSTGMALPTAVLFMFLGAGHIILSGVKG